MNFGLAKEHYSALRPEKANRVKFLVIGDDVAVGRTQGKIVGRRLFPLSYHNSGRTHYVPEDLLEQCLCTRLLVL